jgi:methyl-accepting chemotaxis protein
MWRVGLIGCAVNPPFLQGFSMLHQLKIGPRLALGFGSVILTFLLAMAAILWHQMEVLADARQINEESLPFALLADEMVLDVVQVQQFLQDASATHNRDSIDDAEQHAKEFKVSVDKFRTMFRQENDLEALKTLDDLEARFNEFFALGKVMTEAYITKGVAAGNVIMEDFDKRCDELNETLEKLRKTQVDEANAMTSNIVAASTLSRDVLLMASALGLVLGAVISYLVTRTIVLPVRNMHKAITQIESTSNLAMRVRVQSRDEIGQMASAFNAMLDAQQSALSEVSAVVTALAEGDFSDRIQADLKGDLLTMKTAVNASVDSIQTTMEGLNKIMQALHDGQFDVHSNVVLKGAFKQAVDRALNAMQAMQTLLGDVGEVMSGVAQGQLTSRVQSQGRGQLAILRENINRSLDALSQAIQTISQNTHQVAAAANEFSRAIGQISDGAQSQKHAMSQVAAAVQQTTAAVMDVSRNTEEASAKSRIAMGLVKDGQHKMDTMIEVVHSIAGNSEKINKITEVIEGIANKTNLLSLNAAIEAARAGEHGKGFSVVAEEVGKLAASSGESTQEITQLVQQAVSDALRAVETVKQVADDMRRIEVSANDTDGMLQRISAAMEQQSAAVEEINANIGSLDKIAENNANASEEITATVIELSRLADSTRSEVNKFVVQ